MQVRIGAAHTSGGVSSYRLRVLAAGSPVTVILPGDARYAELDVNGVRRQQTGWDVPIGEPPFGHAVAALRLTGLRSSDRVELHVRGGMSAPRIAGPAAELAKVFDSGFASGAYFAILGLVALFQLVAIFILRERTSIWYVAFVATLALSEFAQDGLFGGGERGALALTTSSVLGTFAIVGFTVSYLRLYSFARTILTWTVLANCAPSIAVALYFFVAHRTVNNLVFAVPPFIGLVLLIWVAVLVRIRRNYTPANYLILGLLGMTIVFGAKLFREFSGLQSPLFDRWGFELGASFDAILFSLGLFFRSRFSQLERAAMERELEHANYEASHDPLTGLLNRRGLDDWMANRQTHRATVLFIDLDGFKAVNDAGGHAAGDDTLSIVGRIIRHAVRSCDAVSRVGGDEFVVVLPDPKDATEVKEIVARITASITNLRPLGASDATRIGVSIGVGSITGAKTSREALEEADDDAYRVKAEHKAAQRAQNGAALTKEAV